MEITDVKIRKIFEEGPMRAIASVTLDDQLAVHDIKVISAREKLFIVMPSRKNPDETFRDIVHPINAGFRAALEGAVLEAYRVALANAETEAEAEEPVTV
jgi:stage V sporulation protein G